jgi:ketosteroid isomerase-like protein
MNSMVEDGEGGGQRAAADDDVRTAIDRQAASDLLVRYVHALDNRDWAVVEQCFTPDAVFIHPGGRVEGAAGIVGRAQAALEPLDGSQHLLGSVSVAVDGDAAQATSYFHAQHVRVGAPGGDLYVIAGTYRDRLRRTAAGWAIFERAQEYTWRSGNPGVIVRGESPEQRS